jgi:hypothetical protein
MQYFLITNNLCSQSLKPDNNTRPFSPGKVSHLLFVIHLQLRSVKRQLLFLQRNHLPLLL